jgi:hypothetical protein
MVTFNLVMILLVIGYLNRKSQAEYNELTSLLESFEPAGACEYSITVERSWLYLGGARSMIVSLKNSEGAISSTTSVFFEPSRISVRGTKFYHFEWSERINGEIRASYLDFEVSRDRKVEWVEVGECNSTDGEEEYLGWKHWACAPRIKSLRCGA